MAFMNLLQGFKKPFNFGDSSGGSPIDSEEENIKKPKMPKLAMSSSPITTAPTTGSSPNPSAGMDSGGRGGGGTTFTPPAPNPAPVVPSNPVSSILKNISQKKVEPDFQGTYSASRQGLDYSTPSRQPVELGNISPGLNNSTPVISSPEALPAGQYNERQNAIARIAPKKWGQLKPYADAANSGDPIDAARYDYINQQAGHGKLHNILMPLLAGAARGILTTGSPWGALGGAAAGGLMGQFNPSAAAGMQYDTFRGPQDEMSLQRQMQIAKSRNDANLANAKIRQEQAQGNYRNAQAQEIGQRAQEGQYLNTNAGVFNSKRGIIPGTAPIREEKLTNGAGLTFMMGQDGKLRPLLGPDGNPMPSEGVLNNRAGIQSREKIAANSIAAQQQRMLFETMNTNDRFYTGLQFKLDHGQDLSPEDIQSALERYSALRSGGNLQPNDPEFNYLTNLLGSTGQFETGIGDQNYPYIKPRINQGGPMRPGLGNGGQQLPKAPPAKKTNNSFSTFDDADLAAVAADPAFGGNKEAARKALEAKGKKYVMQSR